MRSMLGSLAWRSRSNTEFSLQSHDSLLIDLSIKTLMYIIFLQTFFIYLNSSNYDMTDLTSIHIYFNC